MNRQIRSLLASVVMILPLVALCVLGLVAAVISPLARSHAAPETMSLSPTQVIAGTSVTVTGSGWSAGDVVALHLDPSLSILASPTVESDGTFQATALVPEKTLSGGHLVFAIHEVTQTTAQGVVTVLPVVPRRGV